MQKTDHCPQVKRCLIILFACNFAICRPIFKIHSM